MKITLVFLVCLCLPVSIFANDIITKKEACLLPNGQHENWFDVKWPWSSLVKSYSFIKKWTTLYYWVALEYPNLPTREHYFFRYSCITKKANMIFKFLEKTEKSSVEIVVVPRLIKDRYLSLGIVPIDAWGGPPHHIYDTQNKKVYNLGYFSEFGKLMSPCEGPWACYRSFEEKDDQLFVSFWNNSTLETSSDYKIHLSSGKFEKSSK